MFRIGEFSNLAKTTVKTLRFYEEKGLLMPAEVDEWTGYRYYETEQLDYLTKILALRNAGLSVAAVKEYLDKGGDADVLEAQRTLLENEILEAKKRLLNLDNLINNEKEKNNMSYKAVIKELPEYTVYYKRGVIKDFSLLTPFILGSAEECQKANPDIKCIKPDYCYVAYLDESFKPENMTVEYAQAVERAGKETETIKFKKLPKATAVCVEHKGAYERLPEAYAFAMKWIKDNGYTLTAVPRERYIDGIWNKENPEEWLTEIEVSVMKVASEVKERWGETGEYAESVKKQQSFSENEELDSVKAAEKIFALFAENRDKAPDSDEAKALVKAWQEHITKYCYACSKEILASLADMYTCDERFKNNLDSYGEGTAQFMSDAIKAYCK